MLDRKELGSFLRWWRKDSRHGWIYVYLDWAGDLVFRDIRHGRIIGRVFEKDGKCILALRGKPFKRDELGHIKWLLEASNTRCGDQPMWP